MNFPKQVTKNTLVDYPRLNKLAEFLKQTEQLPGAVAEVGVYKGGTAYLLASLTHNSVYLFDTFEGMPETSSYDLHHKGDFADTSLRAVTELLKNLPNAIIYKGIFPSDTAHHVQGEQFSFVHLDCDIYQSLKESLEFFYPRMTQGGIIAFDDYAEPNCPGAKRAIDEFFATLPEKPFLTTQSQAAVIIGTKSEP